MRINGFKWDDNNLEHIDGHNIHDYEVEEAILFDKPIYEKSRNDSFIAYAVTEDGRYIFIVFAVKEGNLIRVITARDMTEREKHNYKKRRG